MHNCGMNCIALQILRLGSKRCMHEYMQGRIIMGGSITWCMRILYELHHSSNQRRNTLNVVFDATDQTHGSAVCLRNVRLMAEMLKCFDDVPLVWHEIFMYFYCFVKHLRFICP